MKRPVMNRESRRLLLWTGLLAVLSLSAFLVVVWEPQQAELAKTSLRQAEIRTARMEVENFNRRHPDLKAAGEKLAVRRERAENLFLTGEGGAEGFFQRELPAMAESTGLILEEMTAADNKAADSDGVMGFLQSRLCRLRLRGSYRSMTEFLNRLEQGARFAAVKNWQLKGSENPLQSGELTLELLLEAYEYKPKNNK